MEKYHIGFNIINRAGFNYLNVDLRDRQGLGKGLSESFLLDDGGLLKLNGDLERVYDKEVNALLYVMNWKSTSRLIRRTLRDSRLLGKMHSFDFNIHESKNCRAPGTKRGSSPNGNSSCPRKHQSILG